MDMYRRASTHLLRGYQKHLEIGLKEWTECMQEKLGKGLGSVGATLRKPRRV